MVGHDVGHCSHEHSGGSDTAWKMAARKLVGYCLLRACSREKLLNLQSIGLFDEAYAPTLRHLSSSFSEISSPIGTPQCPAVDANDLLAQPLTTLLGSLNDHNIKAIPLPKSARHRFRTALVKLRERNFVVE